MTRWWERIPWPVVALMGWCMAGAFGVVAATQRIELDDRHLHIEWGNAAEWLAGVGSTAAFGALLYAAREWRSGQAERRSVEAERQKADKERRDLAAARDAERRDHEISQARLAIVEHAEFVSRGWGGDDQPHPAHRDAIIRNYSDAPVFHLHIEEHLTSNDDVRVWESFAAHRGRPADWPVLAANGATGVLMISGNQEDAPSTEFVEFTFTDGRGARWRRIGSSQPVQLIDSGPKPGR
jgi:hypothetical protein